MTNIKQKIGWMCFLSFLISACSETNEDLVRYIKEVKQRKTKDIPSIPSFATPVSFKFPDEKKRRNPFIPIELNSQESRPQEPLEFFPLHSLKFVGTLRQGNEVRALIEEPNKEITWVRVGDHMGENKGRVLSIKEESLDLVETIKNLGTWEHHKTTIKLYTD